MPSRMTASEVAPSVDSEKTQVTVGLTFINVLDPNDEATLLSQRRAVRSHAAYYQHSQEKKTRGSRFVQHKKPRKPKSVALVPGESVIFVLNRPNPRAERPADDGADRETKPLVPRFAASAKPRVPGIGQGRVDPFRSYPVPWEPFIPELVDHYLVNMAVDLPELDEPEKPGLLRTRWFPLVMTEAATFQVIMLLAASHFASLRPSKAHGPSLLQLKAKALSLIGPALAAEGPSDQLIGAVAKMASYEAIFGEQQSYEQHMKGLVKMIEMRGGLTALGLNGMLAKICLWIDCNAAMIHGWPLHFSEIPAYLATQVNPSGFLAEHDRVREV